MPSYDFKTLSPSDFEILVRDLLRAEFGWKLEAFGHGRDGGVDLRGQVRGMKTIVQCKHYAGSTFADLRAAAREESTKMMKERPQKYLFVTSQNLSRTQKDTLCGELSSWIGGPEDVLAQLDLNELLGRHPQVERQHFKLWLASTNVLERIVQSGLWERSEALMEDISDRVRLYVRSPGYERAMQRLSDGHVVVLTGAPGVGKSMLAEMLLLAHWHEGWRVISVSSNIDEAWSVYQRGERQIFLYDDFLGQTDISERGTKNEDSRIVRFMDRVASDPLKRLVMTTRSQILRQTAITREPIARGNFHLRESVVRLSDYGALERAQILYNHLYFSALPRNVIRDYVRKGRYWKVVEHPNFTPRIIEQVLRLGATTGDELGLKIESTLDRPTALWGTMFASVLSDVAQRIVLSLVSFPVPGVSPTLLRSVAQRAAGPIEYTNALKALEGTFVKIGAPALRSEIVVQYANPSVRDFVLATLDDEPELGIDLLVHSQALGQFQVLFQYAASDAEGGYKFPNLASAITKNQDMVISLINQIVETEDQKSEKEKHPSWYRNSAILQPLAAMLEPAVALTPKHSSALLALAIDFNEGFSDTSTLEQLTTAVVRGAPDAITDVTERLRELVCEWGESLVGESEIVAFSDFVDNNPNLLAPEVNIQNLMIHYIEDALRNEIDSISGNRRNQDSDLAWLDSVESLATRFGLLVPLLSEIESERSSIFEHYEEQTTSAPTSGAGVGWAQRQPEGFDRAGIVALFKQLS
ncbi:restriction endonuclease [Micromonospora matsumotoense]|uniref:nSTAND3 domain-containing NTPase n=1 Tax=Micromonospora matsumotoense TaxID=121616 RepID=UPI0033DEEAED